MKRKPTRKRKDKRIFASTAGKTKKSMLHHQSTEEVYDYDARNLCC